MKHIENKIYQKYIVSYSNTFVRPLKIGHNSISYIYEHPNILRMYDNGIQQNENQICGWFNHINNCGNCWKVQIEGINKCDNNYIIMNLRDLGIIIKSDGTFGDNITNDNILDLIHPHNELSDNITNFLNTNRIFDINIYVIKDGTINDFDTNYKITTYEYNIFMYEPECGIGNMRWSQ